MRRLRALYVVGAFLGAISCQGSGSSTTTPSTGGQLAIWTDCFICGDIVVEVNGNAVGSLDASAAHSDSGGPPNCGDKGTITLPEPDGVYSVSASNGLATTWPATNVTVTAPHCTQFELLQPSAVPSPQSRKRTP
jgi:hypothetical protein